MGASGLRLFFGCLTLWIGCKARLDASSCARDGFGCCVALRLGSDSARVNEVAKLCRAVVLGDERRESSEGSSADVERELDVGWLDDWDRRYKSCEPLQTTTTGRGQESLFITVCDGLDQAFKGIWWMPWH
jgi:hypothetical protein